MRYASHFVPGLDGWRGPMRAACRETQRSHRSGVMLAHGSGAAVRASVHAVGRGEAHERQSSIAARTRSVTSAAVTFHSNGTEISNSGYDVIRTANLRRSGVATIQPSKSFLRCLPAATTAASRSGLRSRGMVSESKIVMGMDAIIADRARRCGRLRDVRWCPLLLLPGQCSFRSRSLHFPF